MVPLQAQLDELAKLPMPLDAENQKKFIELTRRLKTYADRRAQILARTGDEYLTDPPKILQK